MVGQLKKMSNYDDYGNAMPSAILDTSGLPPWDSRSQPYREAEEKMTSLKSALIQCSDAVQSAMMQCSDAVRTVGKAAGEVSNLNLWYGDKT